VTDDDGVEFVDVVKEMNDILDRYRSRGIDMVAVVREANPITGQVLYKAGVNCDAYLAWGMTECIRDAIMDTIEENMDGI
jgi:hypothetical protein